MFDYIFSMNLQSLHLAVLILEFESSLIIVENFPIELYPRNLISELDF